MHMHPIYNIICICNPRINEANTDRTEQEHWCYTIIVGSFSATLSIMERSARQKALRKENQNDI